MILRVPAVAAAMVAVTIWLPADAFGHAAFLSASPPPGQRLAQSPQTVSLKFTEPLHGRLAKATITDRASGERVEADVNVVPGNRLVLRPRAALDQGAYQVSWHSVSTEDGHALEGSFAFGVRASAGAAVESVEQSPLARDGWIRVAARASMYMTVLLFSGALLLRVLLGGGRRSWLVPGALAVGDALRRRAAARERTVMSAVGLAAAVAAAGWSLADAVDAAGGGSPGLLSAFLLGSQAGVARVVMVALMIAATVLTVRAPPAAAVAAVAALAALAGAGHASASSPRLLAIGVDWLHLVGGAVWLGGIAMIVLVWGALLRASGPSGRTALAREVLQIFGRVALPAALFVAATGITNSLIEVERPQALWETNYGRVLLVKVAIVVLLAIFSASHVRRWRPRILADADDRVADRRHWRLLRAEPVLGTAVVIAVAFLAAFPLPPRQLSEGSEARAAEPECVRCPLPLPKRDELAIAEQAGSQLVAAWLRRDGNRVEGRLRIFDVRGKPSVTPIAVAGSRLRECGAGCWQMPAQVTRSQLLVSLDEGGRTYTARLPTRWVTGAGSRARGILERAEATMRALRSVREREVVVSVPGRSARTTFTLQAPDRLAYDSNGGDGVQIGKRVWRKAPGIGWQRTDERLAFRTASWFRWTPYATVVRLLDESGPAGRRTATLALMDPGTPAWHRLEIDLRTHRVLRGRLVTPRHYSRLHFYDFNEPVDIRPPVPSEDPDGR